MRVSIIRYILAYSVVIVARLIYVVETSLFATVVKVVLCLLIVFFAYNSKPYAASVYSDVKDTKALLSWYLKLPDDYFNNLRVKNDETVRDFMKAIAPKPPVRISQTNPLPVSARAYTIYDVGSGTFLLEQNSEEAIPPASTAKIATALTAMEIYSMDEEVAVPQFCTQVDGNKAGFSEGLKFKVSDLLRALLVSSSADAACTLSIGKLSYAGFVGKMNDVAENAGLSGTRLTNPIGLDDTNGENISSAKDLTYLALQAMQNQFVSETVYLKEYRLMSSDGSYDRTLANTNRLLWEIPESVGIKTGTTTGAGEVLIYEYRRDRVDGTGREDEVAEVNKVDKIDLIIVVMGSSDRFTDVKTLLNWALSSYSWGVSSP